MLATVIYDLPLITIPISNYHLFSDINISEGSVAMHLRCGRIFSYRFTANLLLSATMKKFRSRLKLDKVTAMNLVVQFFWNTVYIAEMPVFPLFEGIFMAALWNRAGHYIFALWFLSVLFFLFFLA